jgi:hypothetical protein
MPTKWRGLADRWKSLLRRIGFDDYDPAKHYMRGPGPKTRAREGADEQEPDEDGEGGSGEASREDYR